MTSRTDYDRIAADYDNEPLRRKETDPDLLAFLRERAVEDCAVLDVGCGTGNQLAANRGRFPGFLLAGLDPFAGMLRRAAAKSADVAWVRGAGERLPFRAGSFDFVSNQFAFHHVEDKAAMAGEVARVLRPGGRFVMTNICPREMRGWAFYDYFPDAWAQDLQDFLPRERIAELLERVGLADVTVETTPHALESDLASFAEKIRQRTTSQLFAVSEAAYRAGLRRIESELEAAGGERVPVRIESCLVKIKGDKPR